MTSNQFFLNNWPEKERFYLEGEEYHHICRVARVKEGDKIWLTDGRRRRLLAAVLRIEEDKIWLQTVLTEEEELGAKISLWFGLTKPKTADFIIQKATELGVSEILPLITRRSFKITPDRLDGRLRRWEKIAREALKQSKGAFLPEIKKPELLNIALAGSRAGLKLFLDDESEINLKAVITTTYTPESICLFVGPEGGLEDEERLKLSVAGFKGVSLGRRILRTETAIISAVAIISHFWNW